MMCFVLHQIYSASKKPPVYVSSCSFITHGLGEFSLGRTRACCAFEFVYKLVATAGGEGHQKTIYPILPITICLVRQSTQLDCISLHSY
jgi:hypothetical protein